MSRQEWTYYQEVSTLIKQVKSKRKKQLFALACCRSIEHLMKDQRSKDCLEKIELFIDGKINKEELQLARHNAWDAWAAEADSAAWAAARAAESVINVVYTSDTAANAYAASAWDAGVDNEQLKQLELLKDIYNPFLLNIKFSQQAISLAQQVYKGDNTARGVLSDCLEDEGYPAEIVAHLKSGFHPKGCWLIDQILGKI